MRIITSSSKYSLSAIRVSARPRYLTVRVGVYAALSNYGKVAFSEQSDEMNIKVCRVLE